MRGLVEKIDVRIAATLPYFLGMGQRFLDIGLSSCHDWMLDGDDEFPIGARDTHPKAKRREDLKEQILSRGFICHGLYCKSNWAV